jgi:hypothetical protein
MATPYVPSMSDAAVKAKTGKDWAGWFGALDRAGAAKLEHRAIAQLLYDEHRVPGWWSQMVTVEYERSRGRRIRHQTTGGFQVAVSKTVGTRLGDLYAWTARPAKRRAWFPGKRKFSPSSQTKDKYVRGAWGAGARLEIGFYAKGAGKAQIAVAVTKLARKADVESERAAWRKALDKLAAIAAA